jgi:hypothetical protein
MLYKISDQPFLRFDQHLDIPGLLDLKEELCHAFTEAWLGLGKGNQALPSVAGHPANWPNSNNNVEEVYLPYYEGQELAGALHQTLKNQSAPGHARVKSFVENGHPSYAYMFLKLLGNNQGIGYQMFIRQPTTSNYAEKHLADKTKDSLYYDRFIFFLDWVKKQKIFSEIGRVVIFFNDQHQFCLVHRDHNQFNVVENPDEFVWFNVFPDRKRFYVLDGETGEKHYFDNHAIWFDTANWHGSDPCAFAAFTIRVDGVFTKTWRKKIGYKPKVTEEKKVPKKPSKSKNMWSQAKD